MKNTLNLGILWGTEYCALISQTWQLWKKCISNVDRSILPQQTVFASLCVMCSNSQAKQFIKVKWTKSQALIKPRKPEYKSISLSGYVG